ncbi:putative pectinesterase/pectinesterase inhibitor 33-like [Dorcoceras hygrometricum]|uniref:Putative pectinesterase/pectinesterase inhibitor 33-like n=1 Tax=Dorcoceras hygrometricum TaxID=472368 RepID=A0A2Z7CFB2_9LAMI|nr:putative pectinesterase/pectinesterase inhibitor 33-like [Dorcoceras hygrometricum]
MGTGIEQLNLHSVQLGYLKILQVGNTDPNNTKQEKKYEVKPQYEEPSKQLIMQHDINQCYEMQPVSPSQLGGRHSNPVVTTPMIALDFSGTTHQSASHNVAFNQISQPEIYACSSIKAVQGFSNSYLQQLISTSTDSQVTAQTIEASQSSSATAITVETPWNSNLYYVSNNQLNSNSTSKVLRSSSIIQPPNPTQYFSTLKRGLNLARNHLPKITQHPKNALPDFSRNLRTPAASCSIPQAVLQPLMGNNRKSKPQGCINRGNHRSVIVRPIIHHSSVVFRHNQSVGHHSDDSVGPFRHDTSVYRSQRGSISALTSVYATAEYQRLNAHNFSRKGAAGLASSQRCTSNLNYYWNHFPIGKCNCWTPNSTQISLANQQSQFP